MFNKSKVIMLFLLISSFSFAKISISGFLKEKINTVISKEETMQSTNETLIEECEEEKLEGEQLEYEDGKIKYKFYYKNGEKLPKYYEYYPDGTLKISNEMEIYYEEDTKISNGTYIEYDNKGKVIKKEQYKNNELTGEYIGENGAYIRFYENGKKRVETKYIKDKLEGEYKEYYENGKPKLISNYKDDQLNGKYLSYYEDGKFHLFYLKNWNPYFGSDRKGGWHLLTTKDMVHYGPESAIGILGETGSVIWADGLF